MPTPAQCRMLDALARCVVPWDGGNPARIDAVRRIILRFPAGARVYADLVRGQWIWQGDGHPTTKGCIVVAAYRAGLDARSERTVGR